MPRTLRLPLLAACALLALPSIASAHPAHRTRAFAPRAAALCARADAGRLPSRLAASADQVKAGCATLDAALTAAWSDYTTAVKPLVDQAQAAVDQAEQICQDARATGDRAACHAARQQARATLRALRTQARAAAKTFITTVITARHTFWTAIRSLRGGAAVQPDASTVPSDTPLG